MLNLKEAREEGFPVVPMIEPRKAGFPVLLMASCLSLANLCEAEHQTHTVTPCAFWLTKEYRRNIYRSVL
jgi:hypothetical protein